MAIAVFTDIHGNLEALEAILNDIHRRRHRIKDIYFLGDAVTFGPNSSECIKLLQEHNVKCVIGNHEQRLIRYDTTVAQMTPAGIKHMKYVFDQLDNEDIKFIKSMPLTLTVDYKHFKLHFSHYIHDENGIVLEDMDYFREDLLDKEFAKIDCDCAFFGHLHSRKLYIRQNQKSYFCLDSSGCVPSDTTSYTYFNIGERETDNYDIYRVQVKFDRDKFEKKMREQPIPEKARFAKKYFNISFDEVVHQNEASGYANSNIGENDD
jgi:predicted phosphodiesterase